MNEKIKSLSSPLDIKYLDFRIQSINKGGYATILPYKDARVDMVRLDEVVGQLNWTRHHTRDNKNCIVSIWDDEKSQWVSKEDTGTESNTEKEKGLASDSFKRACFNWGIGRELYNYPVISVKLNSDEVDLSGDKPKATWNLKLKEWKWKVEFDSNGDVVYLSCTDDKNNKRFEFSNKAVEKVTLNEKYENWDKIKESVKAGTYTVEKLREKFTISKDIEEKLKS